MMISQPFREAIFSKNQQLSYSRDWFAYKLILVGSGFQVYIGKCDLNPLQDFEEFTDAFWNFIEHNDEPYQQWIQAEKIGKDLTRRRRYVEKVKKGLKIKKQYEWRKWTLGQLFYGIF